MNLTLDIGNSRSKAALFKGEELLQTHELNREETEGDLNTYLQSHPEIENIIFSTVGPDLATFNSISIPGTLLQLDQNTDLPIQNMYESKETLGSDRISNAVGAANIFPNSNVLVIDAGTCVTLDIITEEGAYLGGSISSGLNMRFQALNTFTENLPLIANEDPDLPDLIGSSTKESIRSGVINGMLAELCGMIEEYNQKFAPLKVLVTGGDSDFVKEGLRDKIDIKKNEIFANPNLVHIGLNAILNFYVEKEVQ
ncbi:MAG: type III pantothenate kinase [Flavobacteriales bacterium]|nr:type III pantothenate kinase [Flavobacteriales bacterium]